MRIHRYTINLIIIIISLQLCNRAAAVFAPSFGNSLPAEPPDLSNILEPMSADWENWTVDEDGNAKWQAFRYKRSGSLAMAIGKPVGLVGNTSDEAVLIKASEQFVNRHADELGLSGCRSHVRGINNARTVKVVLLRPEIDEIPIYGGYVVLSVNSKGALTMLKARGFGSDISGSFVLTGSEAADIAMKSLGLRDCMHAVKRIFLPFLSGNDEIKLRACYEVTLTPVDPGFRPALFIDGLNGEILAAENRIYYDDLEGLTEGWYKPYYRRDDPVRSPFPYEWLRLDRYGDRYSDADGEYGYEINPNHLPLTLFSELRGRYVNVDYEDGPDAQLRIQIRNVEPFTITWDEDNARDDERSLYYHVNFIHDFWTELDRGFDHLDFPLPAVCMYGNHYDNAFYNGRGIYFGEGNEMDNFALYCDIVYHEYGHAVTHQIYPYDILPYRDEPGALNEAWSDYFPCSITDEPYMGEGGLRGNGYVRCIDNNLVYPFHLQGQVHRDSRIISAAMWHSRQVLGREVTDPLFHFARYELGNTFLTYFTDVLLTDDNDGDITNGTPNDRELYEQFGRHGIGPGIKPDIIITQTSLFDDNAEGAEGDDDKFWEPGETIRIELELYRRGTLYPPAAEDVSVSMNSNHRSIQVVRETVQFGDMRVGDRRECRQPLLFRIEEDAPHGFAYFFLTAHTGDNQVIRRDTLRVPLGRPDLLLVKDGDEGEDRTRYFTTALDGLGLIFATLDNSQPMMSLAERLNGMRTVIWFSGDAKNGILSAEDRNILAGFLDDGGNLLMTGQSLGESPGAERFFNDYLGARHVSDSLHQVLIDGVVDDPVAQGLRLLLSGVRGAWNQFRPSAVEAIEPAVEIYHWTRADGQPAAGVRREDPESGARTVYLTFGIEGVGEHGTTARREEVIRYALNWFGVETFIDEEPGAFPLGFELGKPYPNPFNHALTIPFHLTRADKVRLTVFDLTGREVWTGVKDFAAGHATWMLSGEDWRSGIYILQGISAESSGLAKVILIK